MGSSNVESTDLNILDTITIFKCMYYACTNGYVTLKKNVCGALLMHVCVFCEDCLVLKLWWIIYT